jgi:single-strand DNA-binding protein
MSSRHTRDPAPPGDELGLNEVLLRGRVSGEPLSRVLPSGDAVLLLRLVVRRPAATRRRGETRQLVTVDTIDLACWSRTLQRKAARVHEGDVVQVRGALRRRFWRSPGGPASRYEVEVLSLERNPADRAAADVG